MSESPAIIEPSLAARLGDAAGIISIIDGHADTLRIVAKLNDPSMVLKIVDQIKQQCEQARAFVWPGKDGSSGSH